MKSLSNILLALLTLSIVLAVPWAETSSGQTNSILVLISANAEWKVIRSLYPDETYLRSPWGEFFQTRIASGRKARNVIFFQGGWGKVAAAGSTQYGIDRWKPGLLINLGTCGGFKGDVGRHEILLVERTVIYDILEAMGDSKEAIANYETVIDLGWLDSNYPFQVRRTLLVSADRDIVPSEIESLRKNYHAIAADWESGAIAHTCARNKQRLLILRGVSDLVSSTTGGEAYGNPQVFEDGTRVVMTELIKQLPHWLEKSP
jgi:adenosylhomocysteine nucleosidase